MLKQINNLKDLNIFFIKTEIILSIGYFIMAYIYKSTLAGSEILIKDINNINNFIYLGLVNFFIAVFCVVILNKKSIKNDII